MSLLYLISGEYTRNIFEAGQIYFLYRKGIHFHSCFFFLYSSKWIYENEWNEHTRIYIRSRLDTHFVSKEFIIIHTFSIFYTWYIYIYILYILYFLYILFYIYIMNTVRSVEESWSWIIRVWVLGSCKGSVWKAFEVTLWDLKRGESEGGEV